MFFHLNTQFFIIFFVRLVVKVDEQVQIWGNDKASHESCSVSTSTAVRDQHDIKSSIVTAHQVNDELTDLENCDNLLERYWNMQGSQSVVEVHHRMNPEIQSNDDPLHPREINQLSPCEHQSRWMMVGVQKTNWFFLQHQEYRIY